MGNTYNFVDIPVINIKKLFSLWDRGQFIFIVLRTKIMKNTIFVGQNNETIRGLKTILTDKNSIFNYLSAQYNKNQLTAIP